MLRFVIAAVLTIVIVSDADARPWRRRIFRQNRTRSVYTNNYTNYSSNTAGVSYGSGPQATAANKAASSAARMYKGHLGGGFGGGNAEGVGFSTYSAQHALNNCCFTGQRVVAGSSVVRGADGWYAVKIYW